MNSFNLNFDTGNLTGSCYTGLFQQLFSVAIQPSGSQTVTSNYFNIPGYPNVNTCAIISAPNNHADYADADNIKCFSLFSSSTNIKQASLSLEKLILYPDPSDRILSIRLSDTRRKVIVQIYSSTGEVMRRDECEVANNSVQLSVSDLPDGMYVLSIIGNNEIPVVSRRFIIAR